VLLELHDGGLVVLVGDALVDELVGEGDVGKPEEFIGVTAGVMSNSCNLHTCQYFSILPLILNVRLK
jgi:hypothetical protein